MPTKKIPAFLTLLLILLAGAVATAAHAQSNTGSILGAVHDETGAAVPDAAIVVTNIDTSEARTIKSDGAGAFNFSNLPVGHYSITVTRDGFSAIQISDTELQ